MKVEREKPCQRRHHRVNAPLKVTLPDGTTALAANWSLGGLRIDKIQEPMPKIGSELKLLFEIPFQGFDISFDAICKVTRTVPEFGTVAFEFAELSERAHDLMRHFMDDLIRGKMATVDDTICRIDVPVTPISTKPDTNPLGDMPISRWSMKTMFMTGLYTTFSILVFGYIVLLIYSNFMRLEVSSAVVSAPLANIRVPVDGLLQPVRLEEDAVVEKGQALARILDTEIEAKIADKEIELEQAKNALERSEERYRIEANRLKLYQIVNRTDREISLAKVNTEREALAAIDLQVLRLTELRKKGLVIQPKLDDALRQQTVVAGRLKEAELQLERDTAMESVSSRRYFNHKEFVTDLDMFALEIEEASSLVSALVKQLGELKSRRANMVVRAPFDGRIVSTQQIGSTMVFRNQQLLTIEKLQIPTVTAFMDQDQVLEVGLSDQARVFVPALGQHVDAQVFKIDRNSAFLDPKANNYSWSDTKEKSAAVSLRLHIGPEKIGNIRAGLPVIVIFPKRNTNAALQQLLNWLGPFRKEKLNATTI